MIASTKEFTIQFGYLAYYNGTESEVIVPEGVTCIGTKAFKNKAVISITLPETVEEIEKEALYIPSLKEVKLSNNIKKIGYNAFYEDLGISFYTKFPFKCFSKSEYTKVFRWFVTNYNNVDIEEYVIKDNIKFIAKNITKEFSDKKIWCDEVVRNKELFISVLNSNCISSANYKKLIDKYTIERKTDLIAALLEHKQSLQDNKSKNRNELELSVSDWRKLYSFKYTEGFIEITGCNIDSDEIVIPDRIGNKEVKIIGRHAIDGRKCRDGVKRKVIIPESVDTIKTSAFFCTDNFDIYIPESVKSLHHGTFVAIENTNIYVPDSVQEIPDDIIWDCPLESIAIIGKKDSAAYDYAIKNKLKFVSV